MQVRVKGVPCNCNLQGLIEMLELPEGATMNINFNQKIGNVELSFTKEEWVILLETAFTQIALLE